MRALGRDDWACWAWCRALERGAEPDLVGVYRATGDAPRPEFERCARLHWWRAELDPLFLATADLVFRPSGALVLELWARRGEAESRECIAFGRGPEALDALDAALARARDHVGPRPPFRNPTAYIA